MTGIMKVKRLNKSGLFISELDYDNCCISDKNQNGNFVMIIEPLSGEDSGIIYFQKTKHGGYWIKGEGYIITGNVEKINDQLNKWKRKYKKETFKFIEKGDLVEEK
jgi:hypothetical protein